MNILINTYACGPGQGSEPGTAWRWVAGIAQFHQVYVITDDEYRLAIEKEIPQMSFANNIHLFFNPVPERVRIMCRNQGDYRFYYYYKKWQKKSYLLAKTIVEKYTIDVIHHLNLICFREPGYLWRIKGIPYVWGPIGGMNIVPLNYLVDEPFGVRAKYLFKNCVNKLQMRFDQRVRKAANHANVLVAANGEAFKILKDRNNGKEVVLINEAGCDVNPILSDYKPQQESFDILWVGRFLPTKLLGLALKVISKVKDLHKIKLHIVGSSTNDDEVRYYKTIADNLGVNDMCEWHGWISQKEVQDCMRTSRLLLFTSVSEGTPHVVMEAIANGLPVLCFNLCGQGDIVTNEIGCKVDLSTPQESSDRFADLIRKFYCGDLSIDRLAENCMNVRKSLSWDGKITHMMDLYNHIVSVD